MCTCAPGYIGTYCQTDIDECLSEPCLHDGVCINGMNTYNCSCVEGYFGTVCEEEYDTTTSGPTSTSSSTSTASSILTTNPSTPTSPDNTLSSSTSDVNQKTVSKRNFSNYLLLSYKNLSSYFRKRSTAHDSRISSILIGCGALLVTLCAMAVVCVHDCMVFFWTPRRKVEAFDMLRRHGLADPSSRYAVTTTSVIQVREKSHGAIAAVEETVT
ncbi:delta-like protein A [Haliotis rufescens]|uniref:delta-like protein A n=1 Tax=Haliotis rufescens TaxID=6454 RepID=UPI00201F6E9B|nr:delta-like protein A [Haliotis rufescens]